MVGEDINCSFSGRVKDHLKFPDKLLGPIESIDPP
jgi:hypothetical protein